MNAYLSCDHKYNDLKNVLVQNKINIETVDCDVSSSKCLVHSPTNTAVIAPNQHIEEFLLTSGYDIHTINSSFGGQRDTLFSHDSKHIWIGSGMNTSDSTILSLKSLFNATFHTLKLIDNDFQYLDTCFCPLNNNKVMIYSNSFDMESLFEIRKIYEEQNIIEVSRKDAVNGVCNAISINDNVIMNKSSWALIDDLDAHNMNIVSCSCQVKSSVIISQV